MLLIILLEALIVSVAVFAWKCGGAPERATAVMLPTAALLSIVIAAFPRTGFARVEIGYLGVDLILLICLVAVAARANRWWPLWGAALHLVAVSVHGVRGLDPSILPIVYTRMTGFMAIPICLTLALGTANYRRRRRLGQPPRDWSPFRW